MSQADTEFEGVVSYWENRYAKGDNSGSGSYGRLAEYKAKILNDFVAKNNVQSLIEWGSGDGAQLELASYPAYLGLDVSKTSIELCLKKFSDDKTKSFMFYSPDHFSDQAKFISADVSMSLDVIFHLVEDGVYENYMRALFSAGKNWVIVYSSNSEDVEPAPHVRHRRFTDWVIRNAPEWKLEERIENPYPFDPSDPHNTTFADFYIFKKS